MEVACGGATAVPHGWPLGLGNMSSRITAADASQSQPTEAAAGVAPPQPYPSRNLRSSSFSSFSSSNIDTESTESFFPDRSVSLGRLIGIKPMNKGKLIHQPPSQPPPQLPPGIFRRKVSFKGTQRARKLSRNLCSLSASCYRDDVQKWKHQL